MRRISAVFDVRENPVCIQVFSRYIVAVFQHVLQQLFYVWIVGEYIAANFQFFRQCGDLRTAEIEIAAYRKSFRQCGDLRTAEIEIAAYRKSFRQCCDWRISEIEVSAYRKPFR